ncbi:MAG: SWIM zinc finger family protein [Deltaproteobacteria bacterium]|nr:SWIM zinc finger family protein [Deltaproteobacteria bacterium]
MGKKNNKIDLFKNLSWDDLKKWAGSRIASRGKDYQKSGQVEDLALTPDGALVAWVQGTDLYATLVDVQKGELIADCNCPYGDTCKHAVAVVLEGLDLLEKKKEIPICSNKDKRLEALDNFELDEDWEEEWEEDWEEEEDVIAQKPSLTAKAKSSASLRDFLKGQTKPQLISLIQELANTIPEVNQALEDHQSLPSGKSWPRT